MASGLLLGSCSKTQDTAPESRLFGSAPVIENAQLILNSGVGTATCDLSPIIKGIMCSSGYQPSTFDFSNPPVVNVHYTEAEISVETIDPDTKPGEPNDILLVGASYQSSSSGGVKTESTLVVLDDGGGATGATSNQFTYQQKAQIDEGCNPDPNLCADPEGFACGTAIYTLNSNDKVLNDNVWTRGFALMAGSQDTLFTAPPRVTVDGSKQIFAGDCVARVKHQYPVLADVPVGTPVNFKIEVVDRAGNLTQWPQPLPTTFTKTVFDCSGDECACCLIFSNEPGAECKGRPGLTSPDHTSGLCIENFGP